MAREISSQATGEPPAEPRDERAGHDDDGALVERFRSGDARAFDELVRRHQRCIYHVALRYLRNEADAADVAQKTFVRAFQSMDQLRGSATFRSWLYRIAINLSLNHLRDHRREHAAEIHEEALVTAPLGASHVIRRQESDILRGALDALPPRQRMVLELRIYDELGFREIAELVGCTENAAKVNFHHAVKRLRAELAEPPAQVPCVNRDE